MSCVGSSHDPVAPGVSRSTPPTRAWNCCSMSPTHLHCPLSGAGAPSTGSAAASLTVSYGSPRRKNAANTSTGGRLNNGFRRRCAKRRHHLRHLGIQRSLLAALWNAESRRRSVGVRSSADAGSTRTLKTLVSEGAAGLPGPLAARRRRSRGQQLSGARTGQALWGGTRCRRWRGRCSPDRRLQRSRDGDGRLLADVPSSIDAHRAFRMCRSLLLLTNPRHEGPRAAKTSLSSCQFTLLGVEGPEAMVPVQATP